MDVRPGDLLPLLYSYAQDWLPAASRDLAELQQVKGIEGRV